MAAYWNGQARQEQLVLMDPLTAKISVAGVFEGVLTWSGQLVYAGQTAAGYGTDTQDVPHVYELSIEQ